MNDQPRDDSAPSYFPFKREEIRQWVAQGFDIAIHFPATEDAPYLARIDEFGVIGEGESPEAAIDAVLERLADYVYARGTHGEPLPKRGKGNAEHGASSDAHHGR